MSHPLEAAVAAPSTDARIRSVLRAYAAGDAFGVGYEFLDEPVEVDIERLRARDGDDAWALGAVSDDTLLTILTVLSLPAGTAEGARAEFLERLVAQAQNLRGLGPTTRAALGLPVDAREQHFVGRSNGALMRTALVGLGYPGDSAVRRSTVAALARATHPDSAAVGCAVLGAGLVAALFDDPDADVVDTLEREWARSADATAVDLSAVVEWSPRTDGVSLDPVDTLGAVAWIAAQHLDVAGSFGTACRLGGDTDTVAALSGALAAARDPRAAGPDGLPWVDDVRWDEIADLGECVGILSTLRGAA